DVASARTPDRNDGAALAETFDETRHAFGWRLAIRGPFPGVPRNDVHHVAKPSDEIRQTVGVIETVVHTIEEDGLERDLSMRSERPSLERGPKLLERPPSIDGHQASPLIVGRRVHADGELGNETARSKAIESGHVSDGRDRDSAGRDAEARRI